MIDFADDARGRRALQRLGSSLCERYTLRRLIGIGGMAAVYAGVHRNGHAVAVKILHERLASDPQIERLFRREAHLANLIDHPGVVPVIDDDVSDDGCVFLVMPLLEGETLRARVARHAERKLPAEEVAVVGHAVLAALAAAHAKKVVHRDIKPENIFVTTSGEVKVLDFGIGRFFETNDASTATRSGQMMGTPAFMAPEQALGRLRSVDGRTDLWALGATMFTLLSGRSVHEGESGTEIAILAATQPARKLAAVAPEVPPAIADLVDRALMFEREARWEDASAMDGALLGAVSAAFGKDVDELPRITGVAPPPGVDDEDASGRSQGLGENRDGTGESRGVSRQAASGDPRGDSFFSAPTETRSDSEEARAALATRRRKRRAAWGVASIVSISTLAAGVVYVSRSSHMRAPWSPAASPSIASAVPSAPVPPRRTAVVVWSLHNATGDPRVAWLDTGLGEMLRTDLSAGEALRVVPGANSASTRRDFAIADSADLGATDVTRIASALGADVLVDGAYVSLGSDAGHQVRLDLHVKDATNGATLASVTQSGPEDDLFDLVERAAESLRAAMHAPEPDAADVQRLRAAVPAEGDASREYAEGVAQLQALDFAGARAHFERSIALDPRPPMPHAALAEALFQAGYQTLAASEAKAALDRAAGVGREARLAIEARYDICTYDWAGAADRWRVLFELFPDSIDYGANLARVYVKARQPARGLEVVAAMRSLPAPERDDPRIDLACIEAASRTSFADARKCAESALAKAKASGARSLATDAERYLMVIRISTGDVALPLADEFRRIEREFREEGNRIGTIRAATGVGLVYRHLGDFARARHELESAVALAKELGLPGFEAEAEQFLGSVLRKSHDEEGALAHEERALAIGRALGDGFRTTGTLNELGLGLKAMGRFPEARARLQEAATVGASIGDMPSETNALDNLATLLDAMGEPKEALPIHEKMAERYRALASDMDVSITLDCEVGDDLVMGELASASARLDEQERLSGSNAYTRRAIGVHRAAVAALEGDFDRARTLLRAEIDESVDAGEEHDANSWSWQLAEVNLVSGTPRTADIRRWMKRGDPEAVEMADLAVSLALDHKTNEALAAARSAVKLAPKEHDYEDQVRAQIWAADVIARFGHAADAAAIVAPIAEDARKRGTLRWAIEARLVGAEAADPAKDEGARREELSAIETEAHAHSLEVLAKRAAALK